MINTYYKIILMGSVFTLSPMFANAETLPQAVKRAVENHPTIMASRAAEGAAQQTIIEEKSAYYPTANVGASFGRIYSNSTTTRGLSVSRGVGYSWYGDGTGRLNQTLYDWSATDNAVNAAKARYQGAGAAREGQEISISLQAAQAYLQMLRATKLLGVATSNEAEMSSYFDRIKTAFDNGGADESEVSRAQDILSLASNAKIQYESELQIAQAGYREVIGSLDDSEISNPNIDLSRLPNTLDEAISMAVSTNPQMMAAELNVQAGAYDYEREKSNVMPVVDAELSAVKRDQKDLVGGESEDLRGLVRANWSYAFGGAQKASQSRTAMIAKQAEYGLEAMRRTIERDVDVAWVSLNLAKQQKANEQDRLAAAEKTYETYAEQYEGGQQKILDVMGVKNAAFYAEQDYLNITYQEMNAAYNLMTVIGMPLFGEGEKDSNVASAQ